jgi:hypothetical protein
MYNASGFRTETMYDYYIVMKSMFLVVKLSSTLLLVMQASPFSFHELHINNTKTILKKQKPFQNQNFNSHKLYIHTMILYKMKVFLKVTNTSLYINQNETNQEIF